MKTLTTVLIVGFMGFSMFFLGEVANGKLATLGAGYAHYLLAGLPTLGAGIAGILWGNS